MKKSRFSPEQIAKILKEFDNGKSAAEISREYGVSTAAFYKWRERYAGMNSSELKRLKEQTVVVDVSYKKTGNLPGNEIVNELIPDVNVNYVIVGGVSRT